MTMSIKQHLLCILVLNYNSVINRQMSNDLCLSECFNAMFECKNDVLILASHFQDWLQSDAVVMIVLLLQDAVKQGLSLGGPFVLHCYNIVSF